MMDKNLKTIGLAYVETLSKESLTKDQLFEHLYKATGRNCDLSTLRLPTNSAVACLESCKAKCQIKAYEPRIADAFNKLTKVNKIEHKKELLEILNFMTPKPRDYAVMALDKYIKLNPKNTIDGFLKEYHQFKQQNDHNPAQQSMKHIEFPYLRDDVAAVM